MRIEKSDVHQIAEKNDIEVFYPTSIDDTVIEQVKSLEPDLIIVIAYGIILPSKFLNIPSFGCINIHVSLLPRWRGAAPIEHALLAGDEKTGISVISISPKLDAGDILFQESFVLDRDINSDDLTLSLTNLGKNTLLKTLPLLFENKLIRKKQESMRKVFLYIFKYFLLRR